MMSSTMDGAQQPRTERPAGPYRNPKREARDDGVSHLLAMGMGSTMIGAVALQYVRKRPSKPMLITTALSATAYCVSGFCFATGENHSKSSSFAIGGAAVGAMVSGIKATEAGLAPNVVKTKGGHFALLAANIATGLYYAQKGRTRESAVQLANEPASK